MKRETAGNGRLRAAAISRLPNQAPVCIWQFHERGGSGPHVALPLQHRQGGAGFATFLLLSALDVDPDAILANFLESNHWNWRLIQGLLGRIESLGISPDVAMSLLEGSSGYLQTSIQTIEQEWGSTAQFLSEVLGIDVQRVREHYLDRAN